MELFVTLFNAIALCIVRATTATASVDADIVRAFVLIFLFGTIASFAVFRSVYTALRKLRRVLLMESLVWVSLQIAVVSLRVRGCVCVRAEMFISECVSAGAVFVCRSTRYGRCWIRVGRGCTHSHTCVGRVVCQVSAYHVVVAVIYHSDLCPALQWVSMGGHGSVPCVRVAVAAQNGG